jgi:hypothetical protein
MEQHKYILLNTLGQAFILEADMPRDVHAPIERVEEDLLGRSALAERIYTRLCSDDCPQAIGIYGGWGTGKTSLLNLLMEKWIISGNKSLQMEYIDAWQYESNGDLFVPIIVKLMAKRAAINPDLATYLKRVSLAVLYMGTDLALRSLTRLELDDVKKYKDNIESDQINHISQLTWETFTDKVEETNRALAGLVKNISNDRGLSKLIFFIDNLDRCSPENTVRLLESIKNFLIVPGCVWVFAMDAGVVASYINRKYEGTTMDGNSYLDKIIPEQYHLSFFPQENDARIYDLIRSVTQRDLTLNDWKRLPLLPNTMVPRKLKKSAVKFSECFSGNTHFDADRDSVFLLSLLYHTWPDFYERLSSTLENHIGGILANYFKQNIVNEGWRWGVYVPSPLDKKFLDNQDLAQFLLTAFPDATLFPDDTVKIIQQAMRILREAGLP